MGSESRGNHTENTSTPTERTGGQKKETDRGYIAGEMETRRRPSMTKRDVHTLVHTHGHTHRDTHLSDT
jgi:hypothetical protein